MYLNKVKLTYTGKENPGYSEEIDDMLPIQNHYKWNVPKVGIVDVANNQNVKVTWWTK